MASWLCVKSVDREDNVNYTLGRTRCEVHLQVGSSGRFFRILSDAFGWTAEMFGLKCIGVGGVPFVSLNAHFPRYVGGGRSNIVGIGAARCWIEG